MMKSIISVIVPVYNTEKYLRRCLDSILAQTFTDYELILVDDGSTDGSGVICDRYEARDDRIHVIHQSNEGVAAARNAGLDWVFANSESKWLGFVDSDDWVHPRFLELLLGAAESENTLISACEFRSVASCAEPEKLPEHIITSIETPETILTHGEMKIYSYLWDKLYWKDLWREIRFPLGRTWEDIAIGYKLLFSVQTVSKLHAPLYYYYMNAEGITRSPWSPAKLDQLLAMESMLSDPVVKARGSFYLVLKRYELAVLSSYIDEIRAAEGIGKGEKRRYLAPIEKKLRRRLRAYRGELDNTTRKWMWRNAHPTLSWSYWTAAGGIGKISKMFIRSR